MYNIIICLRNNDGKRRELRFETNKDAYKYFLNADEKGEEDEILYVFVEGACVFSALSDLCIFYNDLLEFFA